MNLKKKGNQVPSIRRMKSMKGALCKKRTSIKSISVPPTSKSTSAGYIRLTVVDSPHLAGQPISLKKKSKKKVDNAISLFVAGGDSVDKKVAQANAALRNIANTQCK